MPTPRHTAVACFKHMDRLTLRIRKVIAQRNVIKKREGDSQSAIYGQKRQIMGRDGGTFYPTIKLLAL